LIIGIPRETKDGEFRVALSPSACQVLVQAGHEVWLEAGAGAGCGFADQEYVQRGVRLVPDHGAAFEAPLVVKVKEPQPDEYPLLKKGSTLFCFLHLAAAEGLARALLERELLAIAYETVELPDGSLPILAPMSEIAGKVAIQMAAFHLGKANGGSGKLMGGVPGVPPCEVTVIGAGTVGSTAAALALGMGARVTLINRSIERLRYLTQVLHGNLVTMSSNPTNIAQAVAGADVVVGAVLVPGARAPLLVSREMVAHMRPGSVVVDVAVDQGGCIETCHATSHSHPTYTVDGVIHYCVDNMPGIYPHTATLALSNATLPFILRLASGIPESLRSDPALAKGVNTYRGRVGHPAVAAALGYPFHKLETML
jgi:alanine dehydrogenase